MSQSGRLGNRATMELARQKLDDLDSLIQRMLDLPVVDSDDGAEHVPIDAKPEPELVSPETWNDFRRLAAAPVIEEKQNARQTEPVSTSAEPACIMWWLVPLVAVNRTFDVVTHLFGPLGRWLRSRSGRRVLGWVGVTSLIAALMAALLDGMGWLPR